MDVKSLIGLPAGLSDWGVLSVWARLVLNLLLESDDDDVVWAFARRQFGLTSSSDERQVVFSCIEAYFDPRSSGPRELLTACLDAQCEHDRARGEVWQGVTKLRTYEQLVAGWLQTYHGVDPQTEPAALDQCLRECLHVPTEASDEELLDAWLRDNFMAGEIAPHLDTLLELLARKFSLNTCIDPAAVLSAWFRVVYCGSHEVVRTDLEVLNGWVLKELDLWASKLLSTEPQRGYEVDENVVMYKALCVFLTILPPADQQQLCARLREVVDQAPELGAALPVLACRALELPAGTPAFETLLHLVGKRFIEALDRSAAVSA